MSSSRKHRLYYHQLWFVIGCSIVCLIIYLSLTTSGAMVVTSLLNDKVGHTLGYFGTMLWFMQLYKANTIRLALAVIFICMGIALEYIQGMGGVRIFEVADMAANMTGVVLGWFAAALDPIIRIQSEFLISIQ